MLLTQNPRNGYIYQYENVRTERKFVTCSTCGHKTTLDYDVLIDYTAGASAFVRTTTDGEQVTLEDDRLFKACAHCNSTSITRTTLKKVQHSAKHTCDDRCKTATSDKCLCSCGGKNHGIDHISHAA